MSYRMMTIGAALLVSAAPVMGQDRGTIEFGAYGNTTSFDSELNMNDSWGGGGRVGAFLLLVARGPSGVVRSAGEPA